MRLGLAVRSAARSRPPAARTVVVVTNPNDRAVNNTVTADLVSAWGENGARRLSAREISADLCIGHELFAPKVFDERFERVLAFIVGLIDT